MHSCRDRQDCCWAHSVDPEGERDWISRIFAQSASALNNRESPAQVLKRLSSAVRAALQVGGLMRCRLGPVLTHTQVGCVERKAVYDQLLYVQECMAASTGAQFKHTATSWDNLCQGFRHLEAARDSQLCILTALLRP